MEELLNKLIEKGWKRKGKEKIEKATVRISESWQVYFGTEKHPYLYADTLRGITSLSSGLWQFVCENDYWVCKDTYFVEKYTDHIAIHLYQCNDYRYWLLGSALKDESELEQFLLDNIKIDGK